MKNYSILESALRLGGNDINEESATLEPLSKENLAKIKKEAEQYSEKINTFVENYKKLEPKIDELVKLVNLIDSNEYNTFQNGLYRIERLNKNIKNDDTGMYLIGAKSEYGPQLQKYGLDTINKVVDSLNKTLPEELKNLQKLIDFVGEASFILPARVKK